MLPCSPNPTHRVNSKSWRDRRRCTRELRENLLVSLKILAFILLRDAYEVHVITSFYSQENNLLRIPNDGKTTHNRKIYGKRPGLPVSREVFNNSSGVFLHNIPQTSHFALTFLAKIQYLRCTEGGGYINKGKTKPRYIFALWVCFFFLV